MASANSSNPAGRWASLGFTTTPEERIGPGPPYTYPALQVNLFFRVFLGLISIFITWVPARLLWRNGEFAGTIICVMLLLNNLTTVVNALIWRNDNVKEWFAGYVWCDIQTYTFFALHSAFNISMFEIMRGLANKVALNRAVKPTRSERFRERIVSAAVIFTFPVIQVCLTYFSTVSRYNVSTLVGCSAMYFPNWVYLVFYILPTPVFAFGAAYMAGLAFYRYRKIDKVTRDISRSQDSATAARQHRVRMKLYFMTLVAIIIVLPLVLVLLFVNIIEGAPWDLSYDFNALHYGPDPFNMYFISFTTSDMMTFTNMNIAYISEIAGIAVFIPFGTTPEALNMYREMLLAVGLGYFFPKLKEEYVPRPKQGSRFSWLSLSRPLRGKSLLGTNTVSTRKDSLLPTAEQVSIASRAGRARSSSVAYPPLTDLTSVDMGSGALAYPEKSMASASAHANPWPDLSADEIDTATAQIEAGPPPPRRNPYALLPSTYAKPPKFPSLFIPSLHGHKHKQPQPSTTTNSQLNPSLTTAESSTPSLAQPTPIPFPNPTITPTPHPRPQRVDRGDTASPSSTTTTTTTTTLPTTSALASAAATPWCRTPDNTAAGSRVGVDTRVWAESDDISSDLGNRRVGDGGGGGGGYGDGDGIRRTPGPGQGVRTVAGPGQGPGREGGVRVETCIARRSVEVDLQGEQRGLGMDGMDLGTDMETDMGVGVGVSGRERDGEGGRRRGDYQSAEGSESGGYPPLMAGGRASTAAS